jgi:hypothetical protein
MPGASGTVGDFNSLTAECRKTIQEYIDNKEQVDQVDNLKTRPNTQLTPISASMMLSHSSLALESSLINLFAGYLVSKSAERFFLAGCHTQNGCKA